MMQTITKWSVSVRFEDRRVQLWVYDNHLANVLRKLADLQFTEDGLESPITIEITKADA